MYRPGFYCSKWTCSGLFKERYTFTRLGNLYWKISKNNNVSVVSCMRLWVWYVLNLSFYFKSNCINIKLLNIWGLHSDKTCLNWTHLTTGSRSPEERILNRLAVRWSDIVREPRGAKRNGNCKSVLRKRELYLLWPTFTSFAIVQY